MRAILIKFRQSTNGQSGFTLVELLVTVVIAGLLMGLVFNTLDDLYSSNSQGAKSIIQTSDTKSALRLIADDIADAVSYLPTNSVTDLRGPLNNGSSQWNTPPYNYVGFVEPDGDELRILMASVNATTENPKTDTDGSRDLVLSDADNCSTPLVNNYIYFVSGGSLWRRTIENTATACNGVTQAQIFPKQSCAQTDTSPACASRAKDARIATGVKSFSVHYYQDSNTTTPYVDEYTNPARPSEAGAIEVTLTTTAGVGSNAQQTTDKIRISRINGS